MTDSLTSSPKFLYRGDLAQTPLPEILATIHRYRAPGVVECRRGGDTKNIYLENGNIIFATSTNLADSLGARLQEKGLVSHETLQAALRQMQSETVTRRMGTILVEMKALTPRDLYVSVRDQVQNIVWSVFEWDEGQVLFHAGRERNAELIKLNIPARQAILAGVRRIRDARKLVARVGSKTTVLQPSPEPDFTGISLSPEEANLYRDVNGRRSLLELTQTPPLAPVENAKILYAFWTLGVIVLKNPIRIQVRTTSLKNWREDS